MLSMIVIIGSNNVIGCENKLIWNIPEDLKRFKKLTMGKTIIMGRKTFESLPKVLPGRKHIVLTKNSNYKVNDPNVEIYQDLDKLIKEYKASNDEVFIIGGGTIYKKLIDQIDKLYITFVDASGDGDTFFPDINLQIWKVFWESKTFFSEDEKVSYQYVEFIKKSNEK